MLVRLTTGFAKLPKALRMFFYANAFCTVACLVTELVCALQGRGDTYTDPFFIGYRFFDFDAFHDRFTSFHTAAFFPSDPKDSLPYPAPSLLIYAFFYIFGDAASLNVFLGFTVCSFLLVMTLFAARLNSSGLSRRQAAMVVASGFAMAFPYWFLFQRANIEIVVFLVLALALWAYSSKSFHLAGGLFGLAAAFKIVPILYLGIFLKRQRWQYIAIGLATMTTITVLAMGFVGPNLAIAWHGLGSDLDAWNRSFLQHPSPDGVGFNHTLFGIYSRFAAKETINPKILTWYTISTAATGIVLYLFRIQKLPFINKMTCLVVAAIWLPPVSFDYTLVHLYLVIGVLSLSSIRDRTNGRLIAPLILLAILVSPLSEFIQGGVRYGGQIKSVLLGLLFLLMMTTPIASEWDTKAEPLTEGR